MIGEKLAKLKEENELKSKEVAANLGIAESTYSEWEHDKIPIPTKRLIQIADMYKVNIDYLLGIDKRKQINKKTKINLINIGKRLKEIRKELNLNLRELGSLLNTAFSSLASYERGECIIQPDTLINLCKKNHYSVDWVLGRGKEKKIKKEESK